MKTVLKSTPRLLPLLLLFVLGLAVFISTQRESNQSNPASISPSVASTTPTPTQDSSTAAAESASHKALDTQFREWLNDPRRVSTIDPTNRAQQLAQGLALAQDRRTRMIRLIRENPEQAIREALTFAEWENLPPEMQLLVEKPFSTVADFSFYPVCAAGAILPPNAPTYVAELSMSDGKQREAFVFGKRLDLMSKRQLPVQGIEIDGIVALRQETLQELPADDLLTARRLFDTTQADTGKSFLSGKPVSVDAIHAVAGGKLLVFSDKAELDATNIRLTAADSQPGLVAATSYLLPNGEGTIDWNAIETFASEQADAWTETKKTVFLIRVNFSNNAAEPVTQAAASSVLNGTVSDQIRAMSYNKTWIEATVSANVYTMPQTTTYYANGGIGLNTELLRDARNTFRNNKSGGDASINIGPVSAIGTGGSNLGNYNIVGVTFSSIGMISGGVSYAGLAGGGDLWMQGNNSSGVYVHEFGHNYGIGHASSWDTSDGSVVGTGTSSEYGDIFDIMGSGDDPEGQFHTQAKSKLNWLSSTQWADATALGSNTYRIHRIDDPNTTSTALRGVRVTKTTDQYYWLGYRTSFTQNTSLQKGVYLNWQQAGNTRCWLLDTTPNSTSGKNDAPLTLGRTYSESNTHITPLAVGGSGADRWIDVTVNLGPFPGNSAPVAGAISGPSTVAARSNATFTTNSSDPNADPLAYYWNTKDGLVNDNTSSLNHTWVTGGTYSIDLTVSDMKGGSQTVTKNVTVTDPLDTWTQQTTNNTGYLRAAVWGKDRFVVAELFGTVLTSWDGVTWTNVGELPDFDRDPRLAFGNNMFVAVGKKNSVSASQVCYSPDGRTWSTATFPGGVPQMRDVASSNNQFVAVGDSGTVLTSSNGINWSLTSVSGAPSFRWITHNGSVWVAISTNGASGNDETVWTSVNGTSWTQQGNLGFDVYDLESRGGTLYAVGWYGGIEYSLDNGLTWQSAATPGATRWSTDQIAISPDGTLLVTAKAMDESGAPQALLVSTNGTEWTRSSAGTTFAWDVQALVYGFGRFLASADGGVIRTSNNLYPSNTAPAASFALAPANVPARNNRLYSGTATDVNGDTLTYYWDFGLPYLIHDGASKVQSFDFGGNYNAVLRVFDGKGGLTTLTQGITVSDPARQFTQRTSGTTNNLNAIAANSSIAVAVGGSGGIIRTSTDGVTWTTRTVTEFAGNIHFHGAVWDGAKFILVGMNYNFTTPEGWQGVIYTSPDGTTWTRRYGGGTERSNELYAVSSDGTAAVAVGNNGTILQSADGITWSSVTVSGLSSTTLKGVAWRSGTYITTGHSTAGSGTPRVLSSTNRTNWMDLTSGAGLSASQDMRKIAWLNDRFVSSGWFSKLRVSTDAGATFTSNRTEREELPALAYGDGIYFTAGINRDALNADIDLLSLNGVTWSSAAAPTTSDRNGAVFFKHTFITVGAGGSIWQSADVTPTSSSNNAPVFSGYALNNPYQTNANISLTTLLTAASDVDGDAILITASGNSTQGGTTQLLASTIRYTPPPSFIGVDTFPITLTDARGATTIGTVTVTNLPDPTLATPPTITVLPGAGGMKIDFVGLPNEGYEVQRSINLSNWTVLTTITASPTGVVSYTDPSPPAGKAFYRIRNP